MKNNYIFFFIVLIKIILMFCFSSEYSLYLFQPFVNLFLNGVFNPWQYYYINNFNIDAFPYHPLMLYIHAIPSLLGTFFENIYITNFLFKIPLLLGDILLYKILLSFFSDKKNKVILFYFLNPIIIYGTYIHSQLDIIPMALLFLSLLYLYKQKIIISSICIGLAIATKFHIFLTLPLFFLYSIKKYSFIKSIQFIYVPIICLIIIDLPFIMSDGFLSMVIFNQKQSLLFDFFFGVKSLKIFFPILAILGIYFHFYDQKKVNQILLHFYIGLLFTVTIFLIYPAPAWFIWIIPFISIYFVKNENYIKSILLYIALSISYIIFFIFFYQDDYINIIFLNENINFNVKNNNLTNLSYTFLEAILLVVTYSFFKYGIKNNAIYKKQNNLIIGIAGDSGAGKTTLVNNLSKLFEKQFISIEGDGDHKWERGNKNWEKFTHLDPKANNIHNQAQAINDLKNNKSIFRSEYNHSTGNFNKPIQIHPTDFVAISGLHTFYLPSLRKIIDLKIYLDTEEKLRKHWKIVRDILNRGSSVEKSLNQLEIRKVDAKKHIHPQRNFADLIISFFSSDIYKVGAKSEKIKLGVKIILEANINIECIVNSLHSDFKWDYNEDLSTQFIILNEEPNLDFKLIAKENIINIDELIDSKFNFLNGFDGLIQFLVLLIISDKLKGNNEI